jgi:4-hydroxy-3-methylbut-2-enyl diphosphate reductase IspH
VHHVQTAADLCEEWFFTATVVGITAGTSTPDVLIEGVEQWFQRLESARMASIKPKETTCKNG